MTQPTEAEVEAMADAILKVMYGESASIDKCYIGLRGLMLRAARAALTAAARAKAQALQQISDNIVEKVETRPDHPEGEAAR